MNNDSSPITSILFVCMGNICRSPAGENVMRQMLEEAGLGDEVLCDSAGTIGYHEGSPPDPRMRAAGKRRGLPMTGRARQVRAEDLDRFDLVLAMDEDNHAELSRLATERNRAKIRRFCEFCTRSEDAFVPDPYYGGEEGFERVLDLLEDGCAGILAEAQARRQA